MFRFFQHKETYTGVIEDPRSEKEKRCDYSLDEIASFAPVKWEERREEQWRKFPITDQMQSYSCVGHSIAKLLGIENWLEEKKFVHFSARDLYTRRANFPNPGAWFKDLMSVGHKYGSAFEQLMPSHLKNEKEMNKSGDRTPLTEITAKVSRGGNYLAIPLNIDRIASVIEPTGKGVVIGVRFGPGEWSRGVPLILGEDKRFHHAVVATNAILHQGKKALIIEDSWGINTGFSGRRIMSEDWFNARRISAAWHYRYLSNTGTKAKPKPKHNFTRNLKYGMENDADVKKLQECLAWKRMFPSGIESYTGNFSGITLRAVMLFQETYRNEISKIVGHQIKGTGFVGTGTRTQLNRIFN